MKNINILICFIFFSQSIGINAQDITIQKGKYGAINEKKEIIAPPTYDSAYKTMFIGNQGLDYQYIITVKDGKYGIVVSPKNADVIIIEPIFDTIIHRDYGYLLLKKGNKWGFITNCIASHVSSGFSSSNSVATAIENVQISEIEYDDLYNPSDSRYIKKNNMYGLRYNCSNIVPVQFDTLIYKYNEYNLVGNFTIKRMNIYNHVVSENYMLAKIIKDGMFNYLAMGDNGVNKAAFPYIYSDEEISYTDEGVFLINQKGKPLQLYNVIDSVYVQLKDLQDKEIVLDHYYNFRNGRITIDCVFNPFSNKTDSILKFIGEKNNSKGEIVIFANIRNGQCLVFQNDNRDVRYDLLRIYNKYDKFKGVIKKITKNKIDGETQMDFSLLSFPDRKVLFSITYNPRKEKIGIGYPKEPNFECCCKYFQIVKREENEKISVLGFINIETLEFSKKKPKGCPNDDYKYDYKK